MVNNRFAKSLSIQIPVNSQNARMILNIVAISYVIMVKISA